MKKKKIQIIILLTAVLALNMNTKAQTKNENECLNLYTTGISSEGCIELGWQWLPPIPTDTYGYTLYQWDYALGDWQTVSSNYDKIIKVLNVYPDIAGSNTLQTWMSDTTIGLGKIIVEPIRITDFNNNPDSYLKNGAGEYIYDAIMFGSWDSNNDKDLTSASAAIVNNFLESGRGVLFGHDTQRSAYFPNFSSLKDKIRLHLLDGGPYGRGSERIKVINDGFLLKYPHLIPYESILTIPLAHSSFQFARGVVWMNFPDPLVNSGGWNAPETTINGGTNNFYLTTWNNAAMIQTGHSNGKSTPDERRIIANTLWYLSQFTTDTIAKVCSALDLAAPDIPTVERSGKQINIRSNDNGSPYRFYVKATNTDNYADTCTSNILEVINKSGLKGFYILEDDDPYGLPEASNPATVFITAIGGISVIYTIKNLTYYIHIQAVDSAGNISEIVTLAPFETDLDFDTYTLTLWDNTFLLNLKKLADDGYINLVKNNCGEIIDEECYDIKGCKWLRNDTILIRTNTNSAYSYSAGPRKNNLLELAPTYYTFLINTQKYGELRSTKKMLTKYTHDKSDNLLVYPNPVSSGVSFTVEGVNKDERIYVYNCIGACVGSVIATDNKVALTLNLHPGIYLIRSDKKSAKIVVAQ